MKSPLTGNDMRIVKENRVLDFRKEPFTVVYHYYLCAGTGEQFTDDRLDNLNLNQVYHQYRAKYGIPFTDEIKSIREKYGLSAAKMSDVLGLGANMYRQYESGEMPSIATGRLIRMAEDPEEFCKLLEIGKNALEEHEYQRVKRKVEQSMSAWAFIDEGFDNWLFKTKVPSIYNGFRVPVWERIGAMVSFFAEQNRPFTTAMNKLLFYADFGHFNRYGMGISGLSFRAIQKGPVPANYGGLYNELVNQGYVSVREQHFGDFVGEQFYSTGKAKAGSLAETFTATELEMLRAVAQRFNGCTTKQIVDISHKEDAWQDNVNERDYISFIYGFDLKALD